MDLTTFAGVLLGVSAILLGQTLEGGHVSSIFQLTAALIVLGGTAGAVVTQFPAEDLRRAFKASGLIFRSQTEPFEPLVSRMVNLARLSRREGLLALEAAVEKVNDAFLRQAVFGLVDGSDPRMLRSMLESAVEREEHYQSCGPRMFEAAGGYAPTIGILGAVLGLIHVMQNLSDPSRLGAGIAVAFVATVYGVASANLIFLPFAQKLAMKIERESLRKLLVIEGVCSIQEGINPQLIERRLKTFLEKGGEPAGRARQRA